MEKPRKSQISIAESNLTSRSASHISDSSYASSEPSDSDGGVANEIQDLPANPSPIKLPAASRATAKILENPRKSTGSANGSVTATVTLERQKMTTPYGQILSKNGYVMVVYKYFTKPRVF